jgi:Spy/CpxP family protein refolding chaperone
MNNTIARIVAVGMLAGILAAGFAAPADARSHRGDKSGWKSQGRGGGAAHDKHEQVAQWLGLTDTQKVELERLAAGHRARLSEIQSSNLSDAETQAQLQVARADFRAGAEAVLTPEQKAKIGAAMQQHRRQGGSRSSGLAGAAPSFLPGLGGGSPSFGNLGNHGGLGGLGDLGSIVNVLGGLLGGGGKSNFGIPSLNGGGNVLETVLRAILR